MRSATTITAARTRPVPRRPRTPPSGGNTPLAALRKALARESDPRVREWLERLLSDDEMEVARD